MIIILMIKWKYSVVANIAYLLQRFISKNNYCTVYYIHASVGRKCCMEW
jgi:hypothetical protein